MSFLAPTTKLPPLQGLQGEGRVGMGSTFVFVCGASWLVAPIPLLTSPLKGEEWLS